MPLSASIRTQIGMLVIATSVVQFANGFFGTYISLRVAIEGFDVSGLVLSAYFAGFTLGAFRCGSIIERIGHIRAYAAFAALVAAAVAIMPLLIGSLAWVILRAIVGFGCAGIFVTTESWLTAKALPSERGRVFSIYMVGTFLALALGQLLIARVDVKASASFNAIVALFAVALIMVTTARAEPPRVSAVAVLPYGVLTRAAPIAVTGCALSGLVGGAFYALVPAWMQDQDTPRETIALFMLVAVLGGFAFQIPVGRLSTGSTVASSWHSSVWALPALPSSWCTCRAPCRRSCPPPSCSADSCRHSTPSASPTLTIACRQVGSWR